MFIVLFPSLGLCGFVLCVLSGRATTDEEGRAFLIASQFSIRFDIHQWAVSQFAASTQQRVPRSAPYRCERRGHLLLAVRFPAGFRSYSGNPLDTAIPSGTDYRRSRHSGFTSRNRGKPRLNGSGAFFLVRAFPAVFFSVTSELGTRPLEKLLTGEVEFQVLTSS